MHLEWSVFALTDREAIFDYIEQDSPQAAVTVDDRIENRSNFSRSFRRWVESVALTRRGNW